MAVAPTFTGAESSTAALNKVPGNSRTIKCLGTVGASDTYVTGGFAVTAAQFGVTAIHYLEPVLFSTGHWGFWDATNSKIKVFSAAGTELANASTALQSATFYVIGDGR